jgi:hypothetical protein
MLDGPVGITLAVLSFVLMVAYMIRTHIYFNAEMRKKIELINILKEMRDLQKK